MIQQRDPIKKYSVKIITTEEYFSVIHPTGYQKGIKLIFATLLAMWLSMPNN
jgi:hypothetical protein